MLNASALAGRGPPLWGSQTKWPVPNANHPLPRHHGWGGHRNNVSLHTVAVHTASSGPAWEPSGEGDSASGSNEAQHGPMQAAHAGSGVAGRPQTAEEPDIPTFQALVNADIDAQAASHFFTNVSQASYPLSVPEVMSVVQLACLTGFTLPPKATAQLHMMLQPQLVPAERASAASSTASTEDAGDGMSACASMLLARHDLLHLLEAFHSVEVRPSVQWTDAALHVWLDKHSINLQLTDVRSLFELLETMYLHDCCPWSEKPRPPADPRAVPHSAPPPSLPPQQRHQQHASPGALQVLEGAAAGGCADAGAWLQRWLDVCIDALLAAGVTRQHQKEMLYSFLSRLCTTPSSAAVLRLYADACPPAGSPGAVAAMLWLSARAGVHLPPKLAHRELLSLERSIANAALSPHDAFLAFWVFHHHRYTPAAAAHIGPLLLSSVLLASREFTPVQRALVLRSAMTSFRRVLPELLQHYDWSPLFNTWDSLSVPDLVALLGDMATSARLTHRGSGGGAGASASADGLPAAFGGLGSHAPPGWDHHGSLMAGMTGSKDPWDTWQPLNPLSPSIGSSNSRVVGLEATWLLGHGMLGSMDGVDSGSEEDGSSGSRGAPRGSTAPSGSGSGGSRSGSPISGVAASLSDYLRQHSGHYASPSRHLQQGAGGSSSGRAASGAGTGPGSASGSSASGDAASAASGLRYSAMAAHLTQLPGWKGRVKQLSLADAASTLASLSAILRLNEASLESAAAPHSGRPTGSAFAQGVMQRWLEMVLGVIETETRALGQQERQQQRQHGASRSRTALGARSSSTARSSYMSWEEGPAASAPVPTPSPARAVPQAAPGDGISMSASQLVGVLLALHDACSLLDPHEHRTMLRTLLWALQRLGSLARGCRVMPQEHALVPQLIVQMDGLGWVEAPLEWSDTLCAADPKWFDELQWHEAISTAVSAGRAVSRMHADVLRKHGAAEAGNSQPSAPAEAQVLPTELQQHLQLEPALAVGHRNGVVRGAAEARGQHSVSASTPYATAWPTEHASTGSAANRSSVATSTAPPSKAHAALQAVTKLQGHVLKLLRNRLMASTAGALPQLAAAWQLHGLPYDRQVMLVVLDVAAHKLQGRTVELCQPLFDAVLRLEMVCMAQGAPADEMDSMFSTFRE